MKRVLRQGMLTRTGLACALFALLAGCYASHPAGVLCDCCGFTFTLPEGVECTRLSCAPICAALGDGGVDAGPRRDAPIDPSCGPRPLDLLCLDHIPAGRPTSVSITLGLDEGECFCEQALTCEARIIGDRTLALSTALCPETPICRACEGPPVGTCDLPAMEAGTWRVEVNGEEAMDLVVTDAFPERADVCIRRAVVDSCGATWMPSRFEVGRACHPSAVGAGQRATIRVFDACGGCTQRGPCEVTVFENTIRVHSTRLPNSCDIACPPSCEPDEHVCITPPLAPGRYDVAIEGLPAGSSTVIEVAPGASGEELCVGE